MQDCSVHTDEDIVADFPGVADRPVPDDSIFADGDIEGGRERRRPRMDDTIVFDHRIFADGDFTEVAANHGAGPNRTVLADFDIADNISRFANKSRLMDQRGFAV